MIHTRAVVLDTNVFVAAGFERRGASARILEAIRRGELRLVWDDETHRETRHIVRKIPPLDWSDVAGLFREEDRFAGTTRPADFAAVEDPDDRKFAALAAASGATLLTMDDHLLGARSRLSMAILTPSEFLRSVEAEPLSE